MRREARSSFLRHFGCCQASFELSRKVRPDAPAGSGAHCLHLRRIIHPLRISLDKALELICMLPHQGFEPTAREAVSGRPASPHPILGNLAAVCRLARSRLAKSASRDISVCTLPSCLLIHPQAPLRQACGRTFWKRLFRMKKGSYSE